MDVARIERLNRIINDKVWQRFDNFFIETQTIENSLLKFMAQMDTEEQNLFFSILEDYLIITDYRNDARNILSQLLDVVPPETKIIVCALRGLNVQIPKSGQFVAYEIRNIGLQANHVKIEVYDSPFSDKFQSAHGYKVIVDDFIGTGNQFLGIVAELRSQGLSSHFDAVSSIVIQNEGKLRIEGEGYTIVTSHVRGKCLEGSVVPDAYKLNDSVEKRIGVFASMRRGYNQSEAAVTMRRTPNNTLPAFWLKGNKKWPAPFPR